MKTTFIYTLTDPITNQVRYVGKANDPKRRFKEHLKDKKFTYKTNWFKCLREKDLKPILEIIDEVSCIEWEFWEEHYISLYKSWGFKLTNGTRGGEGIKDYTPEIKLKMRNAKLGKPGSRLGFKASKETCKKLSELKTSKTYEEIYGSKEKADSVRAKQKKIREGKTYEEIYGKEKSQLIRNKMSNKAKEVGRMQPGHIPWNKGVTYSEERLSQMSETTKANMTNEYKNKIRQTVLTTLKKKKEEGFVAPQQKKVVQIDVTTGQEIKV